MTLNLLCLAISKWESAMNNEKKQNKHKMAITHHYCWIVNMKTMMSHIPHACIHFIQLIYFNENDIKLITSSSSLSTESIYLWWWWCSIFKNGGVEWIWTQSLIPLFLTSSKLTRHNHHPRPHVNCSLLSTCKLPRHYCWASIATLQYWTNIA